MTEIQYSPAAALAGPSAGNPIAWPDPAWAVDLLGGGWQAVTALVVLAAAAVIAIAVALCVGHVSLRSRYRTRIALARLKAAPRPRKG